MKYVKKFFVWAFGLIGALLLTIIALQIYYRLTPVEISDEAKTLLEETKHMTQLTENGYRLRGIKAPAGMSAVDYGRCFEVENEREYRAASTAQDLNDIKARWERVQINCLRGNRELELSVAKDRLRIIRPGFDVTAARTAVPNEAEKVLLERWYEVSRGGPRGWNPALYAIYPHYDVVPRLEEARALSILQLWKDEDRSSAGNEFGAAIRENAEFANGNLVETMVAVANISRHLLVTQAIATRSNALADSDVATLKGALAPVDKLREALRAAVAAELQMSAHFWRNLAEAAKRDDTADWWMKLSDYTTDVNDTLNLVAKANRLGQRSLDGTDISAALASLRNDAEGCGWLSEFSYACIPFRRNAFGRITATLSVPFYADYGRRVDDVRNLAAATRLTIEARAKGLQGEALARFIANAPADMRDVVTSEAFAYDSVAKLLTVKLQTRSTVLGAESYILPL